MQTKPEITYDDFAKIDLRVATIVEAMEHPNADRLLKLQIDLGEEKRQICAGIKLKGELGIRECIIHVGHCIYNLLFGSTVVAIVIENTKPVRLNDGNGSGLTITLMAFT